MRTRLILLLILIGTCAADAQDTEDSSSVGAIITSFTGMDYLRLQIDKKELLAGNGTFDISLRSLENGKILWKGFVKPVTAINEGGGQLAMTINNLKPVLWTPNHPALYEVVLIQQVKGAPKKVWKDRAGFRSFEKRGGNLYLNGNPIFLRGIAINPPGRGIPTEVENSRSFALDYVAYMKSINVNIIRIPDAEVWYDVCDELGMMVFGGNYSGKVAGGEKVTGEAKVGDETDGGFPSDYDRGVEWYENKKLGAIAHHPSLMVYAMTNETPFAGARASLWEKFLSYAFEKLKKWDETRVYIANAGYGYGKTGDITDIHRYWGWYYSSPFTFLQIRDEANINPYPSKHQPLTFTECVGNYTGPDGRYNLTPGHKNPSSQLAWTGHAQEDLQASLADYHQSFTFRQATESFRMLREYNPDLSGVFPFTILFYNWNTVSKFDDMKPKPVTAQVKLSYQPVLLSWECWQPNVYAGSTLPVVAHIVNDDNDFRDIVDGKLFIELKDKTDRIVYTDSVTLSTIKYFSSTSKNLSIHIPADLVTGDYQLTGRIMQKGTMLSYNFYRLFIARDADATPTKLTASLSDLRNTDGTYIVIAENKADASLDIPKLREFVLNGGRVLILRQDSVHRVFINNLLSNPISNDNVDIDDPAYPLSVKPPRNGYYLNPERPAHAIFEGISRDNLRYWSDYTNWNPLKKGFPAIQPVTDGFTLPNHADISNTAILANYGSGLQGIAIAEQFQGRGSIILCGLDLEHRLGIDPVATRLYNNLISYASNANGHSKYPLITAPIIWGEYETEKGLVTDLYSGFLVNSTPRVSPDYLGKGIVVTKEGYQLAGGSVSGFNTRPGIQYVANGRRPFGPFAQSFGGQPIPDKNTTVGTASFWCSIPPGQDRVTNIIWNPSKESLAINITVNGVVVSQQIAAGQRLPIETSIVGPEINITYSGDRRLVVLETTFWKSTK
jgi:beta-galactosidase